MLEEGGMLIMDGGCVSVVLWLKNREMMFGWQWQVVLWRLPLLLLPPLVLVLLLLLPLLYYYCCCSAQCRGV